jgi:hypothetical protein
MYGGGIISYLGDIAGSPQVTLTNRYTFIPENCVSYTLFNLALVFFN